MGIHIHKFLASGKARLRLVRTDKHAVRFEQVIDSRTFRQKFRIRKHLEMDALVVRIQDAFHGRSRTYRERRFFDDDFPFVCNFQNVASRLFPILEVRRLPCAMPKSFCRRIDRNENNIGFFDSRGDVRTKEQVPPTSAFHDIVQAGLKNRKVFAVPGINAGLVNIHNSHLDIGALVGDNSHSGATDITRANTNNFGIKTHDIIR